MDELDLEWSRRLTEAEERARAAGRAEVASYLALRAANDLARTAGLSWLLDTFSALADEALLAGANLTFTLEDRHHFSLGRSTMVGRSLTLRAGVRSLTIEAGWPRTPRDGIVPGGGLARARLRHFGSRELDEELLLTHAREDSAPQWVSLRDDGARTAFDEEGARRHLAKLLT